MISNTHVLRPGKTTTPVGFQTGYKSYIKKNIDAIDNIIMDNNKGVLAGQFKLSMEEACKIIKEIYSSIEIESDNCIDEKAFTSLINYLTTKEVNVYVGINRKISRLRKTSRYYSDMPYNRDNDLKKAKEMASEEPTLMLMKQIGSEELGWRGTEFYWPVLVIQENVDTAVYTSELLK